MRIDGFLLSLSKRKKVGKSDLEVHPKMQLLNSNIPQGAQNTKYSNKKAQDLVGLVLFVFCSFYVLQRWSG